MCVFWYVWCTISNKNSQRFPLLKHKCQSNCAAKSCKPTTTIAHIRGRQEKKKTVAIRRRSNMYPGYFPISMPFYLFNKQPNLNLLHSKYTLKSCFFSRKIQAIARRFFFSILFSFHMVFFSSLCFTVFCHRSLSQIHHIIKLEITQFSLVSFFIFVALLPVNIILY